MQTQERGSGAAERKLASEVNEEYHDPFDDWGTRDILLALVPFIVAYAFKDSALNAALAFGIAWSAFLLILRLAMFDGWRKLVWPVIEITSLITFAILRGFTRRWYYHIHKWLPVILPLMLAVVGLLTLAWRRPFTAHYARYPKFDKGGRGLFHGDAAFRRTADLTTLGWITAFSIMLLLSLIPILVGFWFSFHALNTIFNYIVPAVLAIGALIFQQLMGAWYRSTASKTAGQTVSAPERGAAYPSGEGEAAGQGAAQQAGAAV